MDYLSYGKLPITGAFVWMINVLQRLQLLFTLCIKAFACIIQYFSLNKVKFNSPPQWKFLLWKYVISKLASGWVSSIITWCLLWSDKQELDNLVPTRMNSSDINGCSGNNLLFFLTDYPCCNCLYSVGNISFCACLNISNSALGISDVVNSVQLALSLSLDITLFVQICLILNTHETVFTNL